MATRNPSTGMAHLTVVPENFEPAADDETARGDGVDERIGGAVRADRDGERRRTDDESAGEDRSGE